MDKAISFSVNGSTRTITTDPDRPLLEVLREDLGLTGTKYGCGEGQCRACTVLVDGQPAPSCVTPVSAVSQKQITTIEGLERDAKLHPVQEAFLSTGAFQCGYCTPGMIMEVVALMGMKPRLTEAEMLTRMEGHLCRCANYPAIRKAIQKLVGA